MREQLPEGDIGIGMADGCDAEREVLVDGIVQFEQTIFMQLHQSGGSDGFRYGSHHKNSRGVNGLPQVTVSESVIAFPYDVAVLNDDSSQAAYIFIIHVLKNGGFQ